VCIYTQSGTHLVADLDGWMPPGGSYKPITPQRVLDTRPDSTVGFSGAKPGADDVVTVALAPVPGLDKAKATTVVLSVTATDADADAFVTVWSCIGPRPLASNLNVPTGGTRPNLVITGSNSGSTICVSASRSTHLIVDVNGWIPNGATTTIERG